MKIFLIVSVLISFNIYAQENTLVTVDTKGHKGLVKNVMFSPDGSLLYSISDDKTIRVWDVDAGVLTNTFRGYIEPGTVGMLNSGALSYSGGMIAVGGFMGEGSDMGNIRIHDTYTGESLGLLIGNENSVVSLAFSPDDKYLYSGCNDGVLGLWDLSTAEGIRVKAHDDGLYGLAVSPDGDKLLSCGYDKKAILWNVKKMIDKREASFVELEEKHTGQIRNCAYSPTGKHFVTVGFDNKILLWNDKGEFTKEIDHLMDPNYGDKYGVGDVNCVAFSEDGKKIVVGTNLTTGDNAIVYEIPSGKKLLTFKEHTNAVISCAFFGNDLIATAGGDDREIYLWNAKNGEVIHVLKGSGKRMWELSVGPNYQIAFGQDKKTPQYMNDYGSLTQMFDLSTMELTDLPDDLSEFTSEVLNNGDISIAMNKEDRTIVNISNGSEIQLSAGSDGPVRCMSITPKGNVVVGCSYRTKLFDPQGYLLKEFVGHAAEVYGLAFSHDGKYLFTSSGDQSIKIWDLSEEGDLSMTYDEFVIWLKENYGEDALENVGGEEGALELYKKNFGHDVKEIASIFVSIENEWICWTRDNYYATSRYGSRNVGFHINRGKSKEAKYYEFEQFDVQFNRPGKVLQTLGTGSDELISAFSHAYEKRVSKLNYTEQSIDDLNAPELTLRMSSEVVYEPRIKLRFNMMDDKEYLSKVFISNNDVPTTGKHGKQFFGLDSTSYMIYDVDEPLLPGENRIQIWCVNAAGVRSNRETVRIYCKIPEEKPDLYILGFGTSRYKNDKMNLKYAAKDVRDFVQFYTSDNDMYKNIFVDTLTNENVTIENIKTIVLHAKESKITDHLVVYIAGHGLLNADLDYFLATYNVDFNSPAKKGLSYELVEEIVDEIPARTKTIFLDACHSGELDKEELELSDEEVADNGDVSFRSMGAKVKTKSGVGYSNSFALMKNMFTDLREQSGATIIASAGGAEYAFEGDEWNNGVFTYALLDGLKSGAADLDGDSKVMLSELKKYLQSEVSELTSGSQKPISRHENISNDYVFWVIK